MSTKRKIGATKAGVCCSGRPGREDEIFMAFQFLDRKTKRFFFVEDGDK
jgi:hypothetical protein